MEILTKVFLGRFPYSDMPHSRNAPESWTKLLAAVSATCFALGVLIEGLYLATLEVRPVGFLQTQSVFIGVFFGLFLVAFSIVPAQLVRSHAKILILQAVVLVGCLCNENLILYLWSIASEEQLGYSEGARESVLGRYVMGLLLYAGVVVAFHVSLALEKIDKKGEEKKREEEKRKQPLLRACFALAGLWFALQFFSLIIYPRIPSSLGGGGFPVAQLYFSELAPEDAKRNLDISAMVSGPIGHQHYGRILYADDTVVIVQPVQWYSSDTMELKREHFQEIRYQKHGHFEFGERNDW